MKRMIFAGLVLLATAANAQNIKHQWSNLQNQNFQDFVSEGYSLVTATHTKLKISDNVYEDSWGYYLQKDNHVVVCYQDQKLDYNSGVFEYLDFSCSELAKPYIPDTQN